LYNNIAEPDATQRSDARILASVFSFW